MFGEFREERTDCSTVTLISLDFSFDKENNPAVRLEEQLKLRHLRQLQNEFELHDPPDIRIELGGCRPDRVEKRTPGCMNVKEFQDALAKVLGTNDYAEYLQKLFTKVNCLTDIHRT